MRWNSKKLPAGSIGIPALPGRGSRSLLGRWTRTDTYSAPGAEFPFAPERKYTPCDASRHQLYALRDHLGFARNEVVQATCRDTDHRAMIVP
jgi:hypothetical protein